MKNISPSELYLSKYVDVRKTKAKTRVIIIPNPIRENPRFFESLRERSRHEI